MAKKPEFWEYPLGADADVNELDSNLDITKGDASMRGLFPILTSTRLKDGGIPPQRKDINALFKLLGENIYFLQHGGHYEWNNEITYDENAIVLRSSTLYQALSSTQGQDPLSNPGIWKKIIQVEASDLDDLRASLPKSATTESEGLVVLSNEISEDNNTALTPFAVKGLKNDVKSLDTDIRTLQNTVANLDGGSVKQTLDLEQLKSDITAVKEKNAKEDANIQTLESGLSSLKGRVDGLANFNADNIKADIVSLTEKNNLRVGEIETLNGAVENINSTISDINYKANTAVERIDEVNSQINEKTQLIQKVRNDISTLNKEISDINGIFSYSEKDEYNAKNVVEKNGILYKCLADIVKSGKPISPEYPVGGNPEELSQYEADFNRYSKELEVWDETDTGIELENKSYWLPLNDTLGVKMWNTFDNFEATDIVLFNHKLYECLLDNTNTTPTNENVWKELTAQNTYLGIYAWTDTQTFKVGEVVLVNNVLYKAKKQNIGSNPLTDTDAWQALSSDASDGSSDVDVEALRTYMNTLPTRGIYAYDSSKTYTVNQIVNYGNYLWKCTNNTSDVPTEESDSWVRVDKPDASDIFGLMDGVYVYDTSKTYRKNTIVEYNGNLWKASEEMTAVTPILGSKWIRLSGAFADDPVIKGLSDRIDDNDMRDNQQETNLTQLDKKVTSLEKTVGALNTDTITDALGNVQSTVSGLTTRVSNLESANVAQGDAVKANADAITSIETELKATDTALDTKLNGIQTEFNEIKRNSADPTKIQTLETDVQALQTKVQAIEEKPEAKDYDTDIQALRAKDTEIEGRLDTLENASSETDVDATQFNLLKGRVDIIEPKVQTVETAVETLETDVEALKAVDHSQYALKSEIPKIPTIPDGLDTLKTDVSDVKTDVKNLTQADEALDNRIDALEAVDHSQYALKSELPDGVDTLKSDMQTAKTDIENLKKSSGSSGSGSGGVPVPQVTSIANNDDTGFYVTAIANSDGKPLRSIEVINSGESNDRGVKIDVDNSVPLRSITLYCSGDMTPLTIQGYSYLNIFISYNGVLSTLDFQDGSKFINDDTGEYNIGLPVMTADIIPIGKGGDNLRFAISKTTIMYTKPNHVHLQWEKESVVGDPYTAVAFLVKLVF